MQWRNKILCQAAFLACCSLVQRVVEKQFKLQVSPAWGQETTFEIYEFHKLH